MTTDVVGGKRTALCGHGRHEPSIYGVRICAVFEPRCYSMGIIKLKNIFDQTLTASFTIVRLFIIAKLVHIDHERVDERVVRMLDGVATKPGRQ